ncbi:MAG: hypothetical protein J1E29_06475 [Duncaniella sp.]|nr:hypothetical protein [Duncaniella sp.]
MKDEEIEVSKVLQFFGDFENEEQGLSIANETSDDEENSEDADLKPIEEKYCI